MPTKSLLNQLKATKIQITPGAIEILKNSKIPTSMIVNDLTKKWKNRTKPITVKDAIDLMLSSEKYEQISKQLHKEIKTRKKAFISVPRKYRHSFYTLKQFKEPVTAGQVAKKTKRKTNTERVYLNYLAAEGFVNKTKGKDNKILYLIP